MVESVAGGRIRRILTEMRLYRLHRGGLVDAELGAYDLGFLLVEEALEDLVTEAFLSTAGHKGLAKFEGLVGLYPRPNGDLEQRRALVGHRLRLAPGDLPAVGILELLLGCGIQGWVQQREEQLTITIDQLVDSSLSMEQVHHYLEQYLPAHLDWSLIYGSLTFDLLEQRLVDWNQWDETDFDWNRFDREGEELFP